MSEVKDVIENTPIAGNTAEEYFAQRQLKKVQSAGCFW